MQRLFSKILLFITRHFHFLVPAFYVFLLALVFPVSAKFRYPFELGQTWLYNDLISNVDFPIKKNADELKSELVQIENDIVPFYRIDLTDIKTRRKQFEGNFEELIKRSKTDFPDVAKNNEIYENFGSKFLERLLLRGIISPEQIASSNEPSDNNEILSMGHAGFKNEPLPSSSSSIKSSNLKQIQIIRGNEIKIEALSQICSPEKILEDLKDTLTQSRFKEPAFLYITLKDFLTPNVIFDNQKTQQFKQQAVEKIVAARGLVRRGDVIVPRGAIITPEVYQKLVSYKDQYETEYISSRQHVTVLIGYLLLVSLVFVLYFFYFKYFYAAHFKDVRWLIFLYGLIVLHTYLMIAIKSTGFLDVHLLPFCIAPILIKNFLRSAGLVNSGQSAQFLSSKEGLNNEQPTIINNQLPIIPSPLTMAYVTHVVTVLIVGLIVAPPYEFIFLQLLAGLVIAFSRFETRYWRNFFQSIFIVTGVYVLGYLGLSLIEAPNLRDIDWKVFIWLILNGFLTLIAYPLIPLLGQIFGFTSSITLAELSDINHPLLRDLYLKAPGTFQHSLQVAHLSEAVAKAIGADDVLLKVAALYHDVGKMDNPTYFIENQTGKNVHDDLNPFESARIIINHVARGVEYVQKYNLPPELAAFIKTHHGTTYVEYFLNKAEKENNLTDAQRGQFRYDGPTPQSKEETILMLADSIEAWSRALIARSEADFKNEPQNITPNITSGPPVQRMSYENLVRRVIDEKARLKQFAHSRITYEELETCVVVFAQTLDNIYHKR